MLKFEKKKIRRQKVNGHVRLCLVSSSDRHKSCFPTKILSTLLTHPYHPKYLSLPMGRDGCRYSDFATGWGARFSAPVQAGPGAYPASCTMGTGSFSGVKRPGRGAHHPPPSKCRGHERVELYLYSPSGPQWPAIGRNFTLTFTPFLFQSS